MSRISSPPSMGFGSADAALAETFVVPRYLSMFGERMLEMIVPGEDARVCHLQCRTGYPDLLLSAKLPNAHVHGADASEHAIAVARAKAQATPGSFAQYRVASGLPLSFPSGAFSHALTIHPVGTPSERARLWGELARLLAPGGQALVGLPLRGSFAEILDLLRECALKNELPGLTGAVEALSLSWPSDDALVRELEAAGFRYVDLDLRMRALRFSSGRALFEDPVTRLMLLPDLRLGLFGEAARTDDASLRDLEAPLAYVRDAVDKYWSDGSFELTVNVGVVSGRRT